MIVLPKGAFIVQPDKKQEKTAGGIILTEATQEEPNSGIIICTSEEVKEHKGKRVVYRKNFAEDIEIDKQELKFFRDLDSSIYYIIEDEDKK